MYAQTCREGGGPRGAAQTSNNDDNDGVPLHRVRLHMVLEAESHPTRESRVTRALLARSR